MSDELVLDLVVNGVDRASGVLGNITGAMGLGSIAGGALAVALGGVLKDAFDAVTSAATSFFQAALSAERLQADLAAALVSTGDISGLTALKVNELATQYRDLAGGSDEALVGIETIGIRSGAISAEEMPRFIKTVADLGAVMGNTSGAATLLARAQEDPISAMARLSRAGVLFDLTLKDNIKTLVKHGDVTDATALIMDRVSHATFGAAAAAAQTLSGQWEILTNHIGDAGKGIAVAFLPIAHRLFDEFLAPLGPIIEGLSSKFAAFVSIFTAGSLTAGMVNWLADLQIMFPALGNVQKAVIDLSSWIRISLISAFDFLVNVGKGVVDFFVTNWPLIQKTGKVVWDSIIEILGAVGKEFSTVVMPAVIALSGTIDLHLPKSQTMIEGVMAVISLAMRGAVSVINEQVMPAVTKVVNWIVENWPAIQRVASAVFNTVGQILTSNKITLGSALDAMQAGITIFHDILTGKWEDIGKQLQRIWDDNWKTIQTILNLALDLAKKAILAMDWHGIGLSIMYGIERGIEDGAGAAIRSMLNFGSDLKSAIKGVFGIYSPSSVFQGFGANLMEGLSLGITSAAHLPVTAAQNVAHSISNTTQSTTVNNWNLTAQYAYQPERTLADTVRLMRALS